MRLKEAMVAMGTQCSSLAVWSVHMNLYKHFRCAFDVEIKIMCGNLLVVWEIGIGKVEFDYPCHDFASASMQR